MRRSTVLLCCITIIEATPQVTLPFNAQVPKVGRVGKLYYFDLSPSTFGSASGSLAYSLSGQPTWLHINAITGSLYGTPEGQDVGAPQFTILGTDSTGQASMQATLVVNDDPGPQISGDISSAFNGGWMRCGLTCIQYEPNTAFTLQIPTGIFSQTNPVFYYATLDDHTPLPGWMIFDPIKLTFTGTTPLVTTLSQRLNIILVASDIAGFAAVTVPFTFVVSTHQLKFNTLWESVNVPAGSQVSISNLRNRLYLDGSPLPNQYYGSAILSNSPSWLTFDPQTISIRGQPPSQATSLNIMIDAQDTYGDAAFLEIQLKLGAISLFTGEIGVIDAYAGKQFSYQFNQTDFTQTGLTVAINLGQASPWLEFNPSDLTISGTIPWNIKPQLIDANITISTADNSLHDVQAFQIQIENNDGLNISTSSPLSSSSGISRGAIAGVVIAVIAAIISIIIGLFCCRRLRQRQQGMERRPSIFKRMISRPIPQRTADDPFAVGEGSEALEEGVLRVSPQPPQVQLSNLDNNPRRSRLSWRLSHWRPSQDKLHQQQLSSELRQASLMSLNSLQYSSHLQQSYSVYSQNASRMTSPPRYSHHYYSTNESDQNQPITWAQAVREIQHQKRPASSFPNNRPISGIGHGQSFAPYDRASHGHNGESSIFSFSTGYSNISSIPLKYPLPSHKYSRSIPHVKSTGPVVPRKNSQRTSVASGSGSSNSTGSSHNERPVSRRDPYRSAFFASGQSSYHRRMSSAAGRRFAAVGLGLKTIDGSPALEADGSSDGGGDVGELDEAVAGASDVGLGLMESESRAWETTTSGDTSEARSTSAVNVTTRNSKARPVSDGIRHSRTLRSQKAVPSRTSSVYSRDLDGSSIMSGAPAPLRMFHRSRSGSPNKNGGSKTPIMERTRSHYRPWKEAERQRTPLTSLGTNDVMGERKGISGRFKGKGKAREKNRRSASIDPHPRDSSGSLLDPSGIAFL